MTPSDLFNFEHSPVNLQSKNLVRILLCGGAIIDEKNILTAAHCLENNDNKTVFVGDHNREKDDGESAYDLCGWTYHPRRLSIEKQIKNHPELSGPDIAIVHLCEPLTFREGKFFILIFQI